MKRRGPADPAHRRCARRRLGRFAPASDRPSACTCGSRSASRARSARRKAGQAGLAGAQQFAGAAQFQVLFGDHETVVGLRAWCPGARAPSPTTATGTAARNSTPRCRAPPVRAAGAAGPGPGARRSRSPSARHWARPRRPRSPWSPPAGRARPALKARIVDCFSRGLHATVHQADAQLRQRQLQRLERDLRGLRAPTSSESSISVQTQYACRPSAQAARMRSTSSGRRSALSATVVTGVRPGGSSSIAETSRSA